MSGTKKNSEKMESAHISVNQKIDLCASFSVLQNLVY